jgi:hypothetical protein
MQVNCPKCSQELPADQINVAKDTAYCPACREAFILSQLIGADESEPEVDPGDPPPGCRLTPLPNGFVIFASARSAKTWFMIIFTLFWNAITWTLMGAIIVSLIQYGFTKELLDHFSVFTFLFLIPFVLIGLGTAGIAATTIAGHVRVTVQDDQGSIFTGVGSFGWTRRFAWSELRSITEQYNNCDGGSLFYLVLDGRRRIRFGSLLNEERRRYVLAVLRQVLAARRQE